MKLYKFAIVFLSLSIGICSNLYAQSTACENSIRKKYSGNTQDRYGTASGRKIAMLNYYTTHGPGMHKYGNNNALLYIAVVDKYENGQIRGRDTVKLWCVVNTQGQVLGLERDFN